MSFNTAIANQYDKFLQQENAKVNQQIASMAIYDAFRYINNFMENVQGVLNVPVLKIPDCVAIVPTTDHRYEHSKLQEMLKLANKFDSDIHEIINFYDPSYLAFVLQLTEKAEEVKEMSEIFGYGVHKHCRRRADLVATFLPYKGTRAIGQLKEQPTTEEVDDFLQTIDYISNLIDQKLARVPSFPTINILIGESNEFVTRARIFRSNGMVLVSYYNDTLLPENAVSRTFILKDELTKNKHSILLNEAGALDRCLDQLCRTALGFDVQTLRSLMSDCPSTVLDVVNSIAGEYVPDFIHTQGDFYPASTEEGRKEFLQAKAKEIHFALGLVTNDYINDDWRFTSSVLDPIRRYGFGFNASVPVVIDEKFIDYDTLVVTLSQDVFKSNVGVSFLVGLKITEKGIDVWNTTQLATDGNDEIKCKITSIKDALAFAMTVRLMRFYLEALMVDGYLLDNVELLHYPHHIVHRSVQVIKEITQGNK